MALRPSANMSSVKPWKSSLPDWCEVTAWPSIAFLRNWHHLKMDERELLLRFSELACCFITSHTVHQNYSTLQSHITCLSAVSKFLQRRELLLWKPPQIGDYNLLRIWQSTSWCQNPRLVPLVLAKFPSFLWRQGRARVQLCKQPLTYSPLMCTKPQPIRSNFFLVRNSFSPAAFIHH